MAKTEKFSVLYKLSLYLQTMGEAGSVFNVATSDIVSIAMIHNYDEAMFPVIRVRLYSDLSTIEKLTQYPDQIYVSLRMHGNVYRMGDENKSPELMYGANNIAFSLKGYIENKNTPTSTMDQYDHGLKKKADLNINRKVPIDIYCYDAEKIHFMRKKAPSIFKDTSITTVIESMFRNQGIVDYTIEPLKNQNKFDQVLFPNLSISEALSFLDNKYGMYAKGAQVYGDLDGLTICSTDVDNGTLPKPIHVEGFKNSSDMGGMRKINSQLYQMNTKAENVSVISETDIERVLNSDTITSINVRDLDVQNEIMVKLYPGITKDMIARVFKENTESYVSMIMDKIASPDILHKTLNQYIAEAYAARVTERITRVDVSGVGFDIGKLNIRTRYNLIFDSPIRGMRMDQYYRATRVVHVISNLDSDLFIAQTTMSLCSN